MLTVQEIEKAVADLQGDDLASFRTWFEEFDARAWDRQIEQDVQSGKLESMAEQAIHDLKSGRCTEL